MDIHWLPFLKACFTRFADDSLGENQPPISALLHDVYLQHYDAWNYTPPFALPERFLLWHQSIHHQCVNAHNGLVLFGPQTCYKELLVDLDQMTLDKEEGLMPGSIYFPLMIPLGSVQDQMNWYINCMQDSPFFGTVIQCQEMAFWEAGKSQIICKDFDEFLRFVQSVYSIGSM